MRTIIRWSIGAFVLALLVVGVACSGSDSPESSGQASGAGVATATATASVSATVEPSVAAEASETPVLRPISPTVVSGAATTEELTEALDDTALRLYGMLGKMTGSLDGESCGLPCEGNVDFDSNLEEAKALCLASVDPSAFRAEPGYDPGEQALALATLKATCSIVNSIDGNDVRGQALALGAFNSVKLLIPDDQQH